MKDISLKNLGSSGMFASFGKKKTDAAAAQEKAAAQANATASDAKTAVNTAESAAKDAKDAGKEAEQATATATNKAEVAVDKATAAVNGAKGTTSNGNESKGNQSNGKDMAPASTAAPAAGTANGTADASTDKPTAKGPHKGWLLFLVGLMALTAFKFSNGTKKLAFDGPLIVNTCVLSETHSLCLFNNAELALYKGEYSEPPAEEEATPVLTAFGGLKKRVHYQVEVADDKLSMTLSSKGPLGGFTEVDSINLADYPKLYHMI